MSPPFKAAAGSDADALLSPMRAPHLEVGLTNAAAQAVYRRAGFVARERRLMTRRP